MKSTFWDIADLPLSFELGVIGGSACGIIILSFNSLIGRSGTTGAEYVGAWSWSIILGGIMFGAFFGILMAPLGYIIFLRQIGLRKAIRPTSVGTILGGCIGAFHDPACALFSGCLGFFLSLAGVRLSFYFKSRLKQ